MTIRGEHLIREDRARMNGLTKMVDRGLLKSVSVIGDIMLRKPDYLIETTEGESLHYTAAEASAFLRGVHLVQGRINRALSPGENQVTR